MTNAQQPEQLLSKVLRAISKGALIVAILAAGWAAFNYLTLEWRLHHAQVTTESAKLENIRVREAISATEPGLYEQRRLFSAQIEAHTLKLEVAQEESRLRRCRTLHTQCLLNELQCLSREMGEKKKEDACSSCPNYEKECGEKK